MITPGVEIENILPCGYEMEQSPRNAICVLNPRSFREGAEDAEIPLFRALCGSAARCGQPPLWKEENRRFSVARRVGYNRPMGGQSAVDEMPGSSSWRWVIGWFVVTFSYYLLWAWIVPPWQAPDEPLHYEYALALAELQRIPTVSDIDPERQQRILTILEASHFWRLLGEPTPRPIPRTFAESPDPFLSRSGTQISDEPALYYVIPALIFPWVPDPIDQLRVMRIYSALLSATVASMAYATARELWPGRKAVAHVAACWVALLPMAGFIGSSANNDASINAMGALLAWMIVRGVRRGWTPARVAAMAVVLITLPLTKKWGLALIPAGGAALAWPLITRASSRQRKRLGWGIGLMLAALMAVFLFPVSDQPAAWGRRGPVRYGARTSAEAHTGQYAFILPDLGLPEPPWIVQSLPEAIARRMRGQEVTLQAWARAASPTLLHVTIDDGVAPTEALIPVSQRWEAFSISKEISGQATRVRVVFSRGEEAPPREIYLDDVSLTGLGRNWLINGSAEAAKRFGEGFAAAYLRLPPWFIRGLFEPASYDLAALRRYALYIAITGANFWANFGWLTLPLPIWAYGVIALTWILAVWGWRYAGRLWAEPWQRRALALLALQAGCMFAAILLPMIGRDWQPQGRYLFPALVPLAIGWAGGWAGCGDRLRWRRWWIPPVGFMIALSLGSLGGVVIPYYYLGGPR